VLLLLPAHVQDTVRSLAAVPAAPVCRAVTAVLNACSRLVHLARAGWNTTAENRTLRLRLAELEAQLADAQERLQRRASEEAALGSRPAEPAMPALAARVIGADTSNWRRSLLVNVGSTAGVQRGMPVCWSGRVVGKVTSAGPWCSRVLLLTDPASRMGVRDARSRVPGVLEGTVTGCRLKYVGYHQDVRVGDRLVTAGTDGVYPAGLLAGRCVESETASGEILRRVRVEPAIRPERLETVAVLLWASPDRSVE